VIHLPTGCLHVVCEYFDVADLWTLSQTCKLLHELSADKYLLKAVFENSNILFPISQRDHLTKKAIVLFNKHPAQGILFMRENGLIDDTPRSITKFLFDAKELEVTQRSNWLDKNFKNLISDYLSWFDFKGIFVVDALRMFLSTYRFAGDSSKLDGVLSAFADQYNANNANRFANEDTACILAYSIIMLNTDLHNPKVKRHISKKEFLHNLREIDGGANLAEEYLSLIYEAVRNEPFATPTRIERGYWKCSTDTKNWKTIKVQLNRYALFVEFNKEHTEIIPLHNLRLFFNPPEPFFKFCSSSFDHNVQVDTQNDSNAGFGFWGIFKKEDESNRIFRSVFMGSSDEETQTWVRDVKWAINLHIAEILYFRVQQRCPSLSTL